LKAGKRLYLLCSPDRGICEGLEGSVTAWYADEYHEEVIFVGEMMAKEDIKAPMDAMRLA